MKNGSIWKRLEAIEKAIKLRPARQVMVLVDGHQEDQSAADEIVKELGASPDDLVIYLRQFGGDDPDLPRLLSVTPLPL